KAPTEQFITKFARYYTPVVVISALILAVIPPLLISGATFNEWIYRASIFLVISCPCALVVSIPVGFFGGIGSASRKGILIKGSNYLEALNEVEYVVMDKTGTLTKGQFAVTDIQPEAPFTQDKLLELAALAEVHSSHPIAVSIKQAFGKEIDENKIGQYKEISGQGLQVNINGEEVLAGNAKLMKQFGVAYKKPDQRGTVVYVAANNKFAGSIVISDTVREDAFQTISALKAKGIHTIMLTGDS